MWLLYKILFVIFNTLALPIHLIFLLSLFCMKIVVKFLARQSQDFVGTIPGSSCLFLVDDIWDNPHANAVAGLVLEGDATQKSITDTLQKIYDIKNDDGQRAYQELGYYPVRYFGFGFWKECKNFNLADRIHVVNEDPNLNEKRIYTIAERMMCQPYDIETPLWDVYLFHNYDGSPHRTLVLIRLHHLLADGMSILKLFHVGFRYKTLPTFVKPATFMTQWDKIQKGIFSKVKTVLSVATFGMADYFDELLLSRDRNSINYDSAGHLKLTGKLICSFGKKFDVNDLKKAGKGYKCSISHLLLAGLSSAMKRYFVKYHGTDQVPDGFHIVFSVPIPNHPDYKLVNHWTMARIKARLDIQGTQDNVKYLKEEFMRAALSPLPLITAFTFQRLFCILPTYLVDLMTKLNASSTILFSNVPGPQVMETFGDASVTDTFFWVPIVQQSLALSVGMISYNGGIRFCLAADIGCIPDRSRLDDLGMMIHEELGEICKVAYQI